MNTTYIIANTLTIKDALEKLNESRGRTLFIVDSTNKLVGTLSDGDIRRGFLKGFTLETVVTEVAHKTYKFIQENTTNKQELDLLKRGDITLIPIIDKDGVLVRIIDISKMKAILPIDAVIMAGGKGTRLLPLTENTPKPLLKVGDKPIIEYNTDNLASFGIRNLNITINYLGNQIVDFYEENNNNDLNINFIKEDQPLGTVGAIKYIDTFYNDYILLMNSDLLTTIDFEDMFNEFILNEGDMIVGTIPYKVDIPYGVVETKGNYVVSLKEKPTYTYYSNAGIYIFNKSYLNLIPKDTFFNATDFIEALIAEKRKVINYPILNYWLDIGKHEDYEKAQEDIKHLRF
ncbi:nucleotidyltransferase family protein [Lacinutrix salivirga]